MKLIHILALAASTAIVAAAQTTGGGNAASGGQQTAGKAPSPTPTPVAKGSPAARQPSGAKPPATGAVQSNGKKATSVSGQGAKPAGTPPSTTKGGATGAAVTQHAPAAGAAAGTTKTGTSPAAGKLPATGGTAGKAPVTGSAVPTKAGATKPGPAKPGSTKAGKTPMVSKPKPAALKAAKAAPKPPAKAPAAKTPPTPTAAVVAKPRIGAFGRRDPFISPIRLAGPSGPGANCTGGKRCLSIPELVLAGTVKDISGKMMAVVVTSAKKTYTLREKDQVFNGSVEKITTDSVIFREFVKDAIGRESAREVVKKVNPGPTS